MNSEKNIRVTLDALIESPTPLDDYMRGYVAALQWVLAES